MFQAPGQSPDGEEHSFGQLLELNAFHFPQHIRELGAVPVGAHIVVGKAGPGLVLAAEQSAGHRNPGNHPEIELPAEGEDLLLGGAFESIVQDLHHLGVQPRCLPHLKGIRAPAQALAQGDPDMPNLARLYLQLEELLQAGGQRLVIGGGMVLENIDVIGVQGPKRLFDLPAYLFGPPQTAAVLKAVEAMPELSRHDPLRPVVPDVAPDQLFRQVIPVALRGIDQVDPAFFAGVQDGIHLPLSEIFSPFAPELVGADPDYGNLEAALAESSVLHSSYTIGGFRASDNIPPSSLTFNGHFSGITIS